MAESSPRAVHGLVFDMDGTLAVGEPSGHGFILLPGVPEFIAHLRASDVPFVVFTNGTARAPEHYVENLGLAGLRLEPHEMLTPSTIAAEVFATDGFRRVLLLGVSGAGKPLTDVGLEVVRPGEPGAEEIDVVYVAWLPEFGLRDIGAAIDANLRGIDVWVSSDVPFFFTNEGRSHGVSALIAGAIRTSTGGGRASPASLRPPPRRSWRSGSGVRSKTSRSSATTRASKRRWRFGAAP